VNVETSFLQDRSPMLMSSPSKLESGIKAHQFSPPEKHAKPTFRWWHSMPGGALRATAPMFVGGLAPIYVCERRNRRPSPLPTELPDLRPIGQPKKGPPCCEKADSVNFAPLPLVYLDWVSKHSLSTFGRQNTACLLVICPRPYIVSDASPP
jgi:hypothetical protein